MTSVRNRLFFILAAATGLIWIFAIAWIYLVNRNEVEHVLDSRLQEAARMVDSLVASGNLSAPAVASLDSVGYEHQLSCQIWSLDGRLVARSSGAPQKELAEHVSGFSERTVGNDLWRVYTIEDSDKGVRVMVGDRLGLRHRLVSDLVKGLLWPLILIVPMLALLIWASLGQGLKPLNTIAAEISARDAEDMSEIDVVQVPVEVLPLANALNTLLAKVSAARRQEREVTAFAAHELRTPLAGLKTQTQIALAASDPDVRNGALRQVLSSVDRTARLVAQLLMLAKLDGSSWTKSPSKVNLGEVIDDIVARTQANCPVSVDRALQHAHVDVDREVVTVILRNLHENAVQHSQGSSEIIWRLSDPTNEVIVEDEGPGIPDDELPLVRQRFFRGRHRTAIGSGLGLAIVDAAAGKIGWTIRLENRTDRRGLRAILQTGSLDRPFQDA